MSNENVGAQHARHPEAKIKKLTVCQHQLTPELMGFRCLPFMPIQSDLAADCILDVHSRASIASTTHTWPPSPVMYKKFCNYQYLYLHALAIVTMMYLCPLGSIIHLFNCFPPYNGLQVELFVVEWWPK